MLGLNASSSFLGGIRWMRMAPGPFGLSVVCRTSVNSVSMYSLILRTVLVFLNSRGIEFDIVASLVVAKRHTWPHLHLSKYSISKSYVTEYTAAALRTAVRRGVPQSFPTPCSPAVPAPLPRSFPFPAPGSPLRLCAGDEWPAPPAPKARRRFPTGSAISLL